MLRHVDLCSGIGGFALGFEWAGLSKPVLFCDIEPWSRKILAKHWPDVPIEEDVKVLANEPERIPECSILTAGYPCQPWSLAGRRRGETDDRHIWPYIREIVAQKRPTWCVFENVYGHLSMGLDTVLSNLEADGYATRPFIVPACGVDAAHRRDRIWIVGYSDNTRGGTSRRTTDEKRQATEQGWQEQSQSGISGSSADVANAVSKQNNEQRRVDEQRWNAVGWDEQTAQQEIRQASADSFDRRSQDVANASGNPKGEQSKGFDKKRQHGDAPRQRSGEGHRFGNQSGFWKPEPRICRVAYGVRNRVDRLRGLGNAIVPQIAMQIGLTIKAVNDAL
jgi:DNA (cytosine-5)-methyltransferase 1